MTRSPLLIINLMTFLLHMYRNFLSTLFIVSFLSKLSLNLLFPYELHRNSNLYYLRKKQLIKSTKYQTIQDHNYFSCLHFQCKAESKLCLRTYTNNSQARLTSKLQEFWSFINNKYLSPFQTKTKHTQHKIGRAHV